MFYMCETSRITLVNSALNAMSSTLKLLKFSDALISLDPINLET